MTVEVRRDRHVPLEITDAPTDRKRNTSFGDGVVKVTVRLDGRLVRRVRSGFHPYSAVHSLEMMRPEAILAKPLDMAM